MNLLKIILLSVLVGLAFLGAVVLLIGSRLPREHVASRSILLRKPPQDVYAVARDFIAAPTWRPDVERVDVISQTNGRLHFREKGKHGAVNYELAEDVAAQRMVTRILDTDLGYGGKWTYVFVPEKSGTRLTITENGEVSNVVFRFMSRYIFGQTSSIDSYLTSLAKHLGEPAKPE